MEDDEEDFAVAPTVPKPTHARTHAPTHARTHANTHVHVIHPPAENFLDDNERDVYRNKLALLGRQNFQIS